jgi:S1-C subfamily serine protease
MYESTEICWLVARAEPGGLQPLGTCFALGGHLIATALHVVGVEAKNIHVVLPGSTSSGYQDTTDNSVNTVPVTLVHADPIRDLAILSFPEDARAEIRYQISGTDEVSTGDAVITQSFPHANVGRVVLTQQNSNVGARILMENQGLKGKYLVLNTFLRPGQSGGPVFSVKTGNVVAVLVGAFSPEGSGGLLTIAGTDPAALNQTTHAVSAEYVREMLK